jgi:Uma2 family endonuclease
MTVNEFREFSHRPENRNSILELIRGEVVEWPRPYLKHGVVCATVGFALHGYSEATRSGYVVGGNAGVILQCPPPSVVGPDVAYYSHETSDGEFATGWSETLPVLAVEVLSGNDNPDRMMRKAEEYLRNRVPVVWLVGYEEKHVTAYRPDRAPETFPAGITVSCEPELPGLSIQVAEFFRLPGERCAQPPQPPAA